MSKKSRSEGNRVAMAIKASKSSFYVSDVDLEDSEKDVIASAEAVRKTLGKNEASFMIISAGVTKLIVAVNIHESKTGDTTAQAWLKSSLTGIIDAAVDEASTDNVAHACVEIETPFKLKDQVRANAFAYLRKHKLLEEESDDEDEYFDF
jgi:hypothetical protein